MTDRLTGKVALLTGATGGIGAATAEAFAREGADLVLADLDGTPLEALAERCRQHGVDAFVQPLDVTDPARWNEVLSAVEGRFGRLHVLVTLAGIQDWSGVEETTDEAWDRIVAVNQTGTWIGMRAAMPLLRASGNASIVTTSSVLGIIGSGSAAAYQATKGAVRLLTKTAAVEYATRGVRVNSLHPGVVATPQIQDLLDEQGDQQPDVARTPMKRWAEPEEIAPGIVYLASDESSFMTGAELVIDGGLTAH